ncbi:hypothetical protein PGT21_034043 [Puccinia graminis f. sp. tritici]|uniref:Uncharacterized protein n=1 Tax=Puccinia graminis f. sp. tritici TaxID=56615 RepID=A0A5B0QSY1_PUCGR|nr:hypothetical protein PGT21_019145 [Puccinia graminis f. sp. tritici]KAA1116368.1 hypothetical protein PGT21_011033 [Puccinia graminis f. sp. tritici]KAA1118244.1 hypothetical protein PGT21_034043 [Puccinia graminis f. sp. tritici]
MCALSPPCMTPSPISFRTSPGLGEFWCSQPFPVFDTAAQSSCPRRIWTQPLQSPLRSPPRSVPSPDTTTIHSQAATIHILFFHLLVWCLGADSIFHHCCLASSRIVIALCSFDWYCSLSAMLGLFPMHRRCKQPPWVRIEHLKICAGITASSINTRFYSPFSPSPHQLTSSVFHTIANTPSPLASCYYPSSNRFYYPSTMSSIFDNCDTNDFYCEGRSDPSIEIGVRYYPDRDQWSPVFNPNVVPDDDSVGDKGPIDPAGKQGPVDVKPVHAKDKGPAEATVDPALINTILACSASLVYIPKGMEIVETRTHYFPLKDKWHAINDPSRRYDCPHPFVCVPWNVHDPELPPGLPVPFLRNLNPSVPAPTPAPSTSSSESSSHDSDSSSTYPLISNYINLNHQGVQKLLLDDNTPPTAVCIYTEEDVMRIFEGIAPEYVDMCSEYPPSSLAESDRRVMFFENMQWFFRNKRSTYLSTRKF